MNRSIVFVVVAATLTVPALAQPASGKGLPSFKPDVADYELAKPPKTGQGDNGVVPQADIYTVNPLGTHKPWGTIRRYARSFAIGNAGDGWRFDKTYRTPANDWYYGLLSGGDFTKCAWIAAMNLDNRNTTTTNQCSSSGTKFPVTDFASFVNCTTCDGGYLVTTRSGPGCSDPTLYANVKPWTSGGAAQNPVASFTPGVTQVYWRYRTKDDRHIMAGIPGREDGTGEWLFLPRGCLPQVTGYPASEWVES
jgi:hypothetical protein